MKEHKRGWMKEQEPQREISRLCVSVDSPGLVYYLELVGHWGEMRLVFGVHVEARKLVLPRFSCFDLCAKWDECPLLLALQSPCCVTRQWSVYGWRERPDWKVKHTTLSEQLNISFQAHLFSDIYIQILYQYWKKVHFLEHTVTFSYSIVSITVTSVRRLEWDLTCSDELAFGFRDWGKSVERFQRGCKVESAIWCWNSITGLFLVF